MNGSTCSLPSGLDQPSRKESSKSVKFGPASAARAGVWYPLSPAKARFPSAFLIFVVFKAFMAQHFGLVLVRPHYD